MRRATRFIAYGLITGLCAIALAIVHHAGTITHEGFVTQSIGIFCCCVIVEVFYTLLFEDVL